MELEPVIWTVAGILLILAEFAIPGLVIIFFGISALIVGIALFAGMPATSGIPYILFALLAILQIVVLRRYFKGWFLGDSVGNQSEPGELEEFIGHQAVVVSGFEDGGTRGKVEFKGTNWSAESLETLKIGDRVEIVARQGLNLTVKPSN